MQIEFNNESHCKDFIRLNEQWISEYFALEEADRQLASDPFRIVRNGGFIISLVRDNQVVGVCALFKDDEQCYQLARMAIEPTERGKGYGDMLIREAVQCAKDNGASKLYLLSNTVLKPAISLYQKHGFKTLTTGQHPVYARCNITMELLL